MWLAMWPFPNIPWVRINAIPGKTDEELPYAEIENYDQHGKLTSTCQCDPLRQNSLLPIGFGRLGPLALDLLAKHP